MKRKFVKLSEIRMSDPAFKRFKPNKRYALPERKSLMENLAMLDAKQSIIVDQIHPDDLAEMIATGQCVLRRVNGIERACSPFYGARYSFDSRAGIGKQGISEKMVAGRRAAYAKTLERARERLRFKKATREAQG